MPTPTSIKYPKASKETSLTVNFDFDTLTVASNVASTGVYIQLTAPTQEIAGCTVTKGSTGSGTTTVTTNVADGFKYLKVGSVVTLKSGSAGGAVLPSSSTIVSKPNNLTIILNKETGVTNSTSANASTISIAGVSTNVALAKIQITLNGLGTTSLTPVCKVTYFDGSVTYTNANDSNAIDAQTITKTLSAESLLTKAGVAASNADSLDIST